MKMTMVSSSSSSTKPLFPPPPASAPASFTWVPIIRVVRGYQRSQSQSKPLFSSSSTTTRAVDPETNDSPSSDPDTTTTTTPSSATNGTNSFDNRLAELRLRYRSGKGKKADARKGKRSSSSKKGGVFLPPVPLKEAVVDGLKVDFGFSPYTEKLNGRLAALGLAALLLVELGSGKSLVKYHTPPVVLVQIYSVAALSAIYVKYQKEKVSIWPQSSSSSSSLDSKT